jgi:hypothetical protein
MAEVMFSEQTHPKLHTAVTAALRVVGVEVMTRSLSGGPLTADMLRNAERWLMVRSMRFDIAEEVVKWTDGRGPCIFSTFSDAMEIMNGQDPGADVVLLLYSAVSEDL